MISYIFPCTNYDEFTLIAVNNLSIFDEVYDNYNKYGNLNNLKKKFNPHIIVEVLPVCNKEMIWLIQCDANYDYSFLKSDVIGINTFKFAIYDYNTFKIQRVDKNLQSFI